MKKVTLVIFSLVAILFGSVDLSAQGKFGADSVECIKYLSYYKEYFKQKAYDEAIPNWRKAYQYCPATASQNMIIDGTTLVRRLISKNAANAEYKAALVDTLLTLHDLRAANYPKYAVTALNNKGTDMANFVKTDHKLLFDGYEGIIAANKEQTKATILLFDLQAAINLFQEGGAETETVINTYQRNMELIDKIETKTDIELEQKENIKNDMGSLFAASKVASCESLVELFTPRFDANPEDLELASSIVRTMTLAEGCTDNDLFLKAVTVMYKQDPSANSAYYLYRLHSSRDNIEEAIKYMEEAIAAEGTESDMDWSYELAAFCYKNGMSAKAFELASTVAANSETLAGKAYFLIGTIWGTTTCGGDEISRRAPYWVACDYMNKAKNADPTLAEEANRYISQYSVYFPQAAEAFMYDITNGQAYTVVCGGMRATTTVRTVK